MEENKNVCPCCGRHCDLSAPSCERGEEYKRTGVIPERKGHGDHGDHHGRGEHGPHGHGGHDRPEHGEHGPHHGPESGEHGPHRGPHGECAPHHGPHGEHGPHKPHGSILESERYASMDVDGKLMVNIHELRHMGRFGFDGKGGQNRILRMLSEDGGMTQRALTERLGIQPGSASEVLGKLEKAGFIVRAQNEEDRRTTDVSLTEAGKAQAAEVAAQREAKVHEMFAVLTEDEKTAFLAAMEKLNRSWSEKLREQRPGKPEERGERRGHHGDHKHE